MHITHCAAADCMKRLHTGEKQPRSSSPNCSSRNSSVDEQKPTHASFCEGKSCVPDCTLSCVDFHVLYQDRWKVKQLFFVRIHRIVWDWWGENGRWAQSDRYLLCGVLFLCHVVHCCSAFFFFLSTLLCLPRNFLNSKLHTDRFSHGKKLLRRTVWLKPGTSGQGHGWSFFFFF